jgi:hypothetical protein
VGDDEILPSGSKESLLGYHSYSIEILTLGRKPDKGPWQMGSLTGAVASQRVTEALKGTLRMVGNHSLSVNAEECLTARETTRAGTKVGVSDPAVQNGMAVA